MNLWLEFITRVDQYFKYLVTDFGFKKVSSTMPFIVFESKFLRINIFYECGGRYELDLSIDPLHKIDNLNRSFHIYEIARIHNPRVSHNFEWLLLNTNNKLEIGIQELARLMKTYGKDLLCGDLFDLRQLSNIEKELEEKLSQNRGHKTIKELTDELFVKYSQTHSHKQID
jgi:hypothetical protein